jgi:pentatricopeptide repeat protein
MNPNTTTYNLLLKILLSKQDYALMEDIFNEMRTNQLTPNLITLNLMLECYLTLRNDTQFLQMFEMINEFQIVPDSNTFNLLLEFYVKQLNIEKFLETLRHHFDLPESIIRIIDEVQYNQQRVNNIKQETDEDRESERQREVEDKNKNKKKSKDSGSGSKTQNFTHNINEQQAISKLQPTMKTFNLLIKFYGLIQGPQKAIEIFKVLFETPSAQPLYPDNDTFNVLIEVLNPESVLYYWDYMKSKYHVTPNLSNYIAMLQFCGRYNNVTLANSVLQRFFNSHLVGTLTLPWIYINNVLQANKHHVSKKLREWFNKLVKDKFQQNSFILTKSETSEFEQIVFLSKFKISEPK